MEIALASTAQYSTFQFNIGNNVTTMPDMAPCCLFSVPAGKKVRFVMTFNKIDDSAVPTTGLRDNVNIAIYNNANDQLVAYSSAVYENVEIVEFNVSQATQFYVVTSLPSFVQRSSGSFLTFSVAYMLS